jgi:hypothetical protein
LNHHAPAKNAGEGKIPQTSKSLKKPTTREPNEFAEGFKTAFDANFAEKYKWLVGDFIQLAAFRKSYPDVTPARFVAVAQSLWNKGVYCPKAALTIRGHAAAWSSHAASLDLVDSQERAKQEEAAQKDREWKELSARMQASKERNRAASGMR